MAPSLTLLKLDPDDSLYFLKGAQTASQPTRILKLTNASNGCVAFKVKTTAPKSYLVRPSSGTVKPGDNMEVQIILQPGQGSDGNASSHRFLVQAVVAPDSEPVGREAWAEFPKDKIQEARLNVVVEERNVEDPSNAKTPEALSSFSASPNDTSTDLQMKYDELVQYTLMLEKEKKKLEDDLSIKKRDRGGSSSTGYSNMHLMLVAVVVFLLSYCAKFIGDRS